MVGSVLSETKISSPPWGVAKRKPWAKLWLTIAFITCLVTLGRADIVTGYVYGPDGKTVVKNQSFKVETDHGPVSFRTDDAGRFSVYLDPGVYAVRSESDSTLKGVIHGYPQSATEDVHLTR
jgi:hypothetical protein